MQQKIQQKQECKEYTEISIQNGRIRGVLEEGMWAFKGIPFALPPVGKRRMHPPEPAEDWSGTLNCTHSGIRPLQVPPPWCLDAAEHRYGEDCLNLNVWTPASDEKKRPVLFYLFGGGHFEGSNSEQGFDGPHLLHGQDIVMVAANYRLGALGYLYLGQDLGSAFDTSGNLGLLDQVLALRWVRENITSFGGDPERVTLMGQSAGGKSVCNLLVTPAAKGLFSGAIAMSGALQSIKDMKTAATLTGHFLEAAGFARGVDAQQVLTMTPEDILAAQEKANAVYFKAEAYGPTADGVVLPLDVEAYIRQGNLPDVPVLLGHTLQELWQLPEAEPREPGADEIRRKMRWKFGLGGDVVANHYLEARKRMCFREAYGQVVTHYTYCQGFLRTAHLLAQAGLPLYLYRWDYQGATIARHSSDNEALFGRTDPNKRLGYEAESDALDDKVREAFLAFVQDGVPHTADLPEWSACMADKGCRMLLDRECHMESFSLDEYDKDFPLQVMRL